MIVVSCAIGAYAIQNAMFDIWLMLASRRRYVFRRSAFRWRVHAGAGASATVQRTHSGCR